MARVALDSPAAWAALPPSRTAARAAPVVNSSLRGTARTCKGMTDRVVQALFQPVCMMHTAMARRFNSSSMVLTGAMGVAAGFAALAATVATWGP